MFACKEQDISIPKPDLAADSVPELPLGKSCELPREKFLPFPVWRKGVQKLRPHPHQTVIGRLGRVYCPILTWKKNSFYHYSIFELFRQYFCLSFCYYNGMFKMSAAFAVGRAKGVAVFIDSSFLRALI